MRSELRPYRLFRFPEFLFLFSYAFQIVLSRDRVFPCLFRQLFSRFKGYSSTVLTCFFEFGKSICITGFGDFGRRLFREHGEDKLGRSHSISEIGALFHSFELLPGLVIHSGVCLVDFVRQDPVSFSFAASHVPFVGKSFPHVHPLHTKFDPFFRVSLFLIEFVHALHGEFGVFYFPDALMPYFRKPLLERFGAFRRD